MKRALSPPSAALLLPTLGLSASVAVVLWTGASMLGLSPVFQLGVSLSLGTTFGLIWALGVRYPDVGWMVVLAAVLALKAAAQPDVLALGLTTGGVSAVLGAFELATMLAFAGLLLAFFRVPIRAGRLESAFVLAVLAFGGLLAILPDRLVGELDLVYAMPRYLGAVLLGYTAVHGLLTLRPLPPKRRLYVAAATLASVLATACYLVSARLSQDGSLLATPLLDHAFAMTLGVFLLADLVVFHRNYVKDKTSRIARPDGEVDAEVSRELARGLSAVGLSQPSHLSTGDGDFGDIRYRWHKLGSSATWQETWSLNGELRLLFGDIEAPGGLAPLVGAAVAALLAEAKRRHLSLDATARYLNGRLLDLFERRTRVTFHALSFGADGSLEVFNAGGTGVFLASRDGMRHLPLNSTPLGISAELEVAHEPVPFEDGDVVFAAGSTVIEDAASIRRVLAFFDEAMDFEPSLESVLGEVLRLGPSSTRPDRLLLIVERTRLVMQPFKRPG